jgi:diguanylate cyclase (GGDEF)-like protein
MTVPAPAVADARGLLDDPSAGASSTVQSNASPRPRGARYFRESLDGTATMNQILGRVVDALRRRVGLRTRIVVVVLVAITVVAVFVVDRASHYLRQAYYARGGATEQVFSVARTFDGQVDARDLRNHASLRQRLDRLKAGNPSLLKASIYVLDSRGRGRRIAATAPGEVGRPVSSYDVAPILSGAAGSQDVRNGATHVRELNYPLRGGGSRPVAALGLYYDLSAIDAAYARRSRNLVLAALAIATAGAALLGAVLVLLIFRPLSKLRAAARRVRAGDLTGRLNWKRSDELGVLAHDFDLMASAVEERHRFESLALKDPLTGLANHRHFEEVLETEVQMAASEGTSLALGLIDLDHFKSINDRNGHPFGDEVLRRTAQALRGAVRTRDVVARVGGEEFAVVLPGCDLAAGYLVVEKARRAVGAIPAGDGMLSASAGVAAFPLDAHGRSMLVELADGALYLAKRSGRGMTCRYEPEQMDAPPATDDGSEVTGLLADPASIVAVFQPVVDLASGEVAGYEALARFPSWAAHRRPDAWFAHAERWGMRDRLEAAAARRALEPPARPPGTFISINVSPSAARSAEFRAVLPHDLSAVVLEIAEDDLLAAGPADTDALAELRRRGGRVAVDGAGSAYGGLQQLAAFAPDIIKLDGALATGIRADRARAALVASFATFARRIGADLCAKGIETVEDLAALGSLGVTHVQGHALGAPAPPWPGIPGDAVAALPPHPDDGGETPGEPAAVRPLDGDGNPA